MKHTRQDFQSFSNLYQQLFLFKLINNEYEKVVILLEISKINCFVIRTFVCTQIRHFYTCKLKSHSILSFFIRQAKVEKTLQFTTKKRETLKAQIHDEMLVDLLDWRVRTS